jgi:DNA-binding NarL/FixJ family response regulator
MHNQVSIALADSSPVFRMGLLSLLNSAGNYGLIGEASDPEEMKDLLTSFRPDVLIVDFLSEGFSVDDIVEVKRIAPSVKLLAITPQQSGSVLINALRAGIDSYIKKNCSIGEVMEAIQETAEGGRFFCGRILEAIRAESIDVEELVPVDYTCDPVGLSNREAEVITLIAEGFTNALIAERLFISAHTVNTHRKNIMQKLGVNNTAALVMYAVKSGFTSPNRFLFHQS